MCKLLSKTLFKSRCEKWKITKGWLKDRRAGYWRQALPVSEGGHSADLVQEGLTKGTESPHKGLIWLGLANHEPLSNTFSLHLELLCTIGYGKFVQKWPKFFISSCTWGSEALPIPRESELSLWFAIAQRMQRQEGLSVPTLGLHRTWVLPFALLDLASPEENNLGLVWWSTRCQKSKSKAIPDIQLPDTLLTEHKYMREPSLGQPSLTLMSNPTHQPTYMHEQNQMFTNEGLRCWWLFLCSIIVPLDKWSVGIGISCLG